MEFYFRQNLLLVLDDRVIATSVPDITGLLGFY